MRHPFRAALLTAITTATLAVGCTPLSRSHLVVASPIAHTAEAEHDFGPGRANRATAIYTPSTDLDVPRWAETPALSPGDRLQIDIEDGEQWSGRYEVDVDGCITLAHLPPLNVADADTPAAARGIADALVRAEFFKPQRVRVSVSVHEWAPVQIHVSGAVFNPGMVSINARMPEERALKIHLASGDYPSERMLVAALRAAGGVRPDAAIEGIRLSRSGKTATVNYAGLMQGEPVPRIQLVGGDTIFVPSSGRFDRELVAPSAITPPGIRVFLSNLTVPVTGNAVAAVNKESSSLPYGSRLLTAAVSANCVGGTMSTSASRYAVLVRIDPLTGKEEVVERAIHDLFEAPHRDNVNPLLMPNDSVSCYDSDVTNFRDILRTVFEIIAPFSLLL